MAEPEQREPSDEDLMSRIAGGDRRAFDLLIRRHLAGSVALAGRISGDRAAAEDVAHDAFLRLWRAAPDWRPQGARFTTWFYRVILNLCRDRARRKRSLPLEAAGDPADPAPGALALIAAGERERRLRAAIADLPERQRTALALCHYQGLSNQAAGAIMNLGVGAIESLLVRARRSLREALRDLAEDGGADDS